MEAIMISALIHSLKRKMYIRRKYVQNHSELPTAGSVF